MNILESIKGKVIVSVQAMPGEPLYKEECMKAMMASVVNGGASALRVAGVRDIKNAKEFGLPVIGITKPDKLPDNWLDVVYITATKDDIIKIINAGADIVAFDGTNRKRPDGSNIEEIISIIHENNRIAMADISTLEEGINCAEAGCDIISTTLSGYTSHSLKQNTEPDFDLLKQLNDRISRPVILEGRIWEPSHVKKAFLLGAHSVVIGSAITRPQLITKRFTEGF